MKSGFSQNRTHRAAALLLAMAISPFVPGVPAAMAQDATGNMPGIKLSGDQPIQIDSDKLEVREADGMAIFTGNVSVVQGTTLMKSGEMKVFYKKDSGSATTGSAAIDRLEATGKIYVKSDNQIATGEKGTYDMNTETLVLSGDKVVLSEGDNVAVGCKLTVLAKTGEAKLESCKGSKTGRVSIVVAPKSAQENQKKN